MIASFFDAEQTADGLRALVGGSQRGTDLHMLMRLASKADLVARPVRLSIGELKRIRRPAILHWCMDHFVVLIRVKADGIVINDPALGQRFVTLRELDECFTGVALEVVPSPDFGRQRHEGRIRIRDFLRSFRYVGRYLSAMLVLLLAIQLLSLVPAPVQTSGEIELDIRRKLNRTAPKWPCGPLQFDVERLKLRDLAEQCAESPGRQQRG